MRYIKAALALLFTLWVVIMVAVFGMISLFGPHSPRASPLAETLFYVIAGAAVLVFPALAARAAWRSGKKDA